ncbi:Protein kinase-like domain protein [Niveomyces insectorum RCEF 264]|uniref:Protein kinase-like domain protein n=1 Tax=Niveomyces insectorum RCEF 264 TaxID=1081102 RepID=A0A167U6Y0_9HYPO|nr:Protein kinase-like domain protein [Niveomyces insectorum RCEF 264]
MATLVTLLYRLFYPQRVLSSLHRWFLALRLYLLGLGTTQAPLGLHLQQIIKDSAEYNAAHPLQDNFCPSFSPRDGPVVATRITRGISYYFTTSVFVKRQPHVDELGLDLYGQPVVIPYIADRLRNEAAALQFIRAYTSIPVPVFLSLWEENGLVHLKTGMVCHGIELRSVSKSLLPTAIERVTAQLESDILPQLQRLRRRFIGSANPLLPVVVPHLLWEWKDTRTWPQVTAETDEFVFVHTDLDRQNILVDPDTFHIVCILDWETAGFFPPAWELPKWKVEERSQEKYRMTMEAKKRQLAFFGTDFLDEDGDKYK